MRKEKLLGTTSLLKINLKEMMYFEIQPLYSTLKTGQQITHRKNIFDFNNFPYLNSFQKFDKMCNSLEFSSGI